jgi:hypothetical protein
MRSMIGLWTFDRLVGDVEFCVRLKRLKGSMTSCEALRLGFLRENDIVHCWSCGYEGMELA